MKVTRLEARDFVFETWDVPVLELETINQKKRQRKQSQPDGVIVEVGAVAKPQNKRCRQKASDHGCGSDDDGEATSEDDAGGPVGVRWPARHRAAWQRAGSDLILPVEDNPLPCRKARDRDILMYWDFVKGPKTSAVPLQEEEYIDLRSWLKLIVCPCSFSFVIFSWVGCLLLLFVAKLEVCVCVPRIQNLREFGGAPTTVVSRTLAPNSRMWMRSRRRLLTPEETLCFHGVCEANLCPSFRELNPSKKMQCASETYYLASFRAHCMATLTVVDL